jgi:hypothetical protein
MRVTKIIAIALCAALAGCSATPKPSSDLSGAGFVMASPNAASRAFIIANDRQFAEDTAINRAACLKSPMCRK